MTVFQNTKTHPRVLLVNHLQSGEEKWYRTTTLFILTSRRTEIATSAWEPKKQWLLGNALVQSCLERKNRLLDNSRSQSPQWRMWISKQSPICSRGARLSHSMDPVVSVQNKNFAGDSEEPNEVPGADEETKSHLYWHFPRIGHILWRPILESLYVNTSLIVNEWDCWESGAQN